MIRISWLRPALLLTVSVTLFLASCKKDTDVNPSQTNAGLVATITNPTSGSASVNSWILANMKYYYLWNDKIPANPDTTLSPDKFFYTLLYDWNNTANVNRDRFSWIRESADDLKASLGGQSKTTGMQYRLYYKDQSKTSIVGSVLYVLPGSPAAGAGLKRGDIFTKINGQLITSANYSDLLASDVITLSMASLVNSTLTETNQTRQMTPVVLQEDPVLLDTTYSVGGKTVGYLVYNQFIPGVFKNGSDDKTYDNKLDNVFSKFKQKGVNELVLDLRYNPGGYVSSSTNLASLIGKNIDESKIYYAQQWNSTVMADRDKKYGSGWNMQTFASKAANIGTSLSRVFVLTTGSTASASELIINGLRPFMTITTIGSTTVGKNVGSVTIADATGKIKWGMQPLTFKSANAQGFSDYATGFVPTVEVKEPSLGMKAFGDLSEPLLSEAIYQISGTRISARRGVSAPEILSDVASSLDQKAGGGNMYVEMPRGSVK